MGQFKFSLSHKVSLQPAWNTLLQTYHHSSTENRNHENFKAIPLKAKVIASKKTIENYVQVCICICILHQ